MHSHRSLGLRSSPQVSRDGAWLAFTADTRGDEAYQVYVQEVATKARSAVTLPDTAAASSIVWAGDNATLFFMTKASSSHSSSVTCVACL